MSNHYQIIYVFQLEKSKYFVYLDEPNKTDAETMLSAEIQYDFLKKYRPLKIIKKIKQSNMFDLDNYVKQYMILFGYQHVRGGSYIEELLSPQQEELLMKELNTASNYPNAHALLIKEVIRKYASVSMSKKDILLEKTRVESNYLRYKKEKNAFDEIEKNDPEGFLKDLVWLKKTAFTNIEYSENGTLQSYLFSVINKEQRIRYANVIAKIKNIYQLFVKLTEKNLSSHPPYIKYPEFLFDDFFYHWRNVSSETAIENIEKFCHTYEFFTNTIINRMDEVQYDINTWENDIEWKTRRILYLLDKCETETHRIL
jgi:hypothetical protein